MKKIHLLIIFALQLFVFESNAQITTNLVVSSTPPATLSTWSFKRETIVFLVSNQTPSQLECKIKTEIQLSDGTVIGKTDLTRSKTYVISGGNMIFNADDVLPLESMIFSGKYKTSLERTGKLPSDIYQICVQLVEATGYVPITNANCKTFNLAALQLPMLVKPSTEQMLDEVESQSAITFRWTPVVPTPQFVPIYKILVFEVLQDQTPIQALRSNQPILEQEVRGTTQYIWMPKGILNQNPSDENGNVNPKKLVWTIQTFDNQETVLSDSSNNGDGVSEPTYFYIANKKTTTKE